MRAEISGHVRNDVVRIQSENSVQFVFVIVIDDFHRVIVDGLHLQEKSDLVAVAGAAG